jgi:CMP-N-acetylneuraminic acid synthetase
MKKLLITICARGGSKGIPRKNIRKLAGKELIAYSINHAEQFKSFCETKHGMHVFIEISTDDIEIKQVAESFGIQNNYLRPDFLANDTAGKLDVLKDITEYSEKSKSILYDYILDLDVSAPMRSMTDLEKGLNLFLGDDNSTNLFSVSSANKNPYYNMVEQNDDGYYRLCKTAGTFLSRQKAPEVYEMNASFYFYHRKFFNTSEFKIFERALIYNMTHESFDLDNIIDFEFLDFLVSNNKLTFEI